MRFPAIATVAGVLLLAASATAQTPALQDAVNRMTAGDKVIVLDASGRTASGLLERVNGERIVVRTETATVDIPASEVRRVAVPRHGKRNGFLIGAGFGLFIGAVTSQFVETGQDKGALIAISTGLYGAIGLGLGSLWPSERVIYRAPNAPPTPKSTAFAVPGRRLGVSYTVTW